MSCPQVPEVSDPSPLRSVRQSRQASALSPELLGNVVGHALRGYDVAVCTDCGFGFADGIPEQATFDRYYREMSKYEFQHRGGHVSDAHAARFREMATAIGPLSRPAIRTLDIGCGTAAPWQCSRNGDMAMSLVSILRRTAPDRAGVSTRLT